MACAATLAAADAFCHALGSAALGGGLLSLGGFAKRVGDTACAADSDVDASARESPLWILHAGGGTASKLESGAGIAVLVPANGRYEDNVYGGSGQATAQALVAAFARHAERVDAINARDCNDAQQKAAAKNYEYLICPTILHWEDRATEWSGIRDKIEGRVQLRLARSGSVVDTVIIAGQSKFASFGGDHPQELLAKPVERYATSLF